jgi:two-component system, LuxR family, sensor kinase FixL
MSENIIKQPQLLEEIAAGLNEGKRQADRRFVEASGRSRMSVADAMGAALAHELNQPLAALTIYLQSVQRQFEKKPELLGELSLVMLKKAIGEAERTTEIVRRMRRFSAISEPERSPIDFNLLADESIELSTVGLQTLPIFERNYHESLPIIAGDPVQIRQIMVNLLCNAVDAVASHDTPRISITTRRQDGFVHFSISDNGSGVDKRIAANLFKAFETSKPHGMGLGLAISRMIAQNHGGELSLDPGGDNAGACFDLRLPIIQYGLSEVIR